MLRKLICSCAKWRCPQTISSSIPFDYMCANAPIFGGGGRYAATLCDEQREPKYSDQSHHLNNAGITVPLTLYQVSVPLRDRNHRPTDFKPGFCWSAAQFFSASTFCFIQTFTGCENDNRAGPKLTMTPAPSCAPLRRARYQYQLWICMQAIYRHILAMTLLTVSNKSAPS